VAADARHYRLLHAGARFVAHVPLQATRIRFVQRRSHRFPRHTPGTRVALRLFTLVALIVPPIAASAQGRLEPHERERLRHELREQRHAERDRSRDPAASAAESRRGLAPGTGQPVDRGSDVRPVDVADWAADPREARRAASEPRPRMTPEEREALRLQIRERRRAGE
jgi:hypothetical protein